GTRDDWVFVRVRDDGAGIAPEHLTRLFEPFFTTKPVGQGTGLGLSVSYSIVAKHHGRLEVASEPGRGAAFTVWLPLRQPSPAAAECLPGQA
ncbi:PAS domain-containing sensor histidine kinase, partial [Pseudomonas sp. CrR25]|nr:PAS domain-containing sensor histidine kinase [Pseudomonas sp. CrR25]